MTEEDKKGKVEVRTYSHVNRSQQKLIQVQPRLRPQVKSCETINRRGKSTDSSEKCGERSASQKPEVHGRWKCQICEGAELLENKIGHGKYILVCKQHVFSISICYDQRSLQGIRGDNNTFNSAFVSRTN